MEKMIEEEKVVLVNEQDEVLGLMNKLEAHQKGLLHRAISVMLINSKKEILIQQRSSNKYHWPLIWANACCSHPRENESYYDAAIRRTKEELGILATIKNVTHFIYRAEDKITGLIEHELDYVFLGLFDGEIPFNPTEIHAVRWISKDDLESNFIEYPDQYAFWFKELYRLLNQENSINRLLSN